MAFLTIVIQTASNSIDQLNQMQFDQTLPKSEWNQLIDYLGRCAGGNEVVQAFYVVTRDTDPAVATSGTDSEKIVYTPNL